MLNAEVLIIGGGLAGLCCALSLHERGVSSQVLEGSNSLGGRVQTDEQDGFLLDRGFQVLLTAYPEAKRVFDYGDLQLSFFEPGALVRYRGKFHRFVDPWRRPGHLFSTAMSPIASFADKLRVATLKREVCKATLEELYQRPETTTYARLKEKGFSDRIIEHFFRPFLGGVFLESELNTSSRKFDFVFRMFADGHAALPAKGMRALPDQLVRQLPSGKVQTNARVSKINGNSLLLESGQELTASRIVVACEAPAAAKLFGSELLEKNLAAKDNVHFEHDVTCLYFAANKPPIEEPILVLNGEGKGPINSLCVPSQVASGYAPEGQSLVSVTVLGNARTESAALRKQVLDQLSDWFGSTVNDWRFLKTIQIPYALPRQAPPNLTPVEKSTSKNGAFVCGDYLDSASIQGAMASGRRAADAVVASL